MPAFDPTNLTAYNEGLYTFQAGAELETVPAARVGAVAIVASRHDVVKW